MRKIYIIHENQVWIEPLIEELEKLNAPFELWHMDNYKLDINTIPPEGIFYNRMSASSHTRGHRFAPEYTAAVLRWLESHGRTILNGRRALSLELSKMEQYVELQKFGIKTPRTILARESNLLEQANSFADEPFIIKPNRGGKGAGVQLFYSIASLKHTLENNTLGTSVDGLWLIQQYVKPANGTITRVEFINGKYHYAVRVDASSGFELCPADTCQVGDAFCPIDGGSKFQIHNNYENSDLDRYDRFLKENRIDIGAIEYSKDTQGNRYVYDVNTNTNYNRAAELEANVYEGGMMKIASELNALLSHANHQMKVA